MRPRDQRSKMADRARVVSWGEHWLECEAVLGSNPNLSVLSSKDSLSRSNETDCIKYINSGSKQDCITFHPK